MADGRRPPKYSVRPGGTREAPDAAAPLALPGLLAKDDWDGSRDIGSPPMTTWFGQGFQGSTKFHPTLICYHLRNRCDSSIPCRR